jgi:type IV pilus assembly protein PilV
MRPTVERRATRGVGLIDALIAIVILSFGLIGMVRMQGRLVSAATDSQLRTTAIGLADELLNTMLVDTDNAACYTYPTPGAGCASASAQAATTAWAAKVVAALPGASAPAVTLMDANTCRMRVEIGWTPRLGAAESEGADTRLLRMETDARGEQGHAC